MTGVWTVLLVAFVGVNLYALTAGGGAGLIAYLRSLGPWGALATADLLIALLIGISWTAKDARARGINPLPFTLLTLATGSAGLLFYLVRHGRPGASVTPTQAAFRSRTPA